jgi:hypothetical protein
MFPVSTTNLISGARNCFLCVLVLLKFFTQGLKGIREGRGWFSGMAIRTGKPPSGTLAEGGF